MRTAPARGKGGHTATSTGSSLTRPATWAIVTVTALATAGASLVAPVGAGAADAAATPLLLSEYVEGSGNNKALELHNASGAPVDLAAEGYDVQIHFNGATAPGVTIALTGTVAPGDVHVLAHAEAAAEVLAQADQRVTASLFNGDDSVVVRRAGVVVDSVGQVGVDPGTQWGSGLVSTADNTLRRLPSVTVGDTDPTDAYDPIDGWDGFAVDSFDGLGRHGNGAGPDPDPDPEPEPGTPDPTCGAAATPIGTVQGPGDSTSVSTPVAIEGVVVGDHEGPAPALRGFYLQDAGDGDDATSDAVFVFNGNDDRVSLGDRVRVVGTPAEYQGQTQVGATTSLTVCGAGEEVDPTSLSFPTTPATLESLEGMLVRVPQTMSVTEHFQLGRFGQVVVSSGGRLQQPTDVVAPGEESAALQASNDARRLVVDDSSQAQNPDPVPWGRAGEPLSASNTLRGGDTLTDAVGVLTYTWGGNSASPNAYRLRPLGALGGRAVFEPTNQRPAGAPDVGGRLQVAGMNVLNYFNTFTGCTLGVGGASDDCRGADDAVEFERQAAKTVAALAGMDAEVVGLVEIENDGYSASSALADLTDRLEAVEGAGEWSWVDADAGTGQVNALGTDAIKVGLIYRSGAVTPVGRTAVLNTPSFVTGGDAEARNRPALMQSFRENATGAVFSVVVNHLKSKGSACAVPDAGDGQGQCNQVRVNAARELAAWIATDPTGVDDDDVLILGDLNAYAKEDPVRVLEEAGYTNLVDERLGEGSYSYVFDGQWGSLDHALGTASLDGQVTGAAPWWVNADEPSVLDYNTDFKSPAQVDALYAPDEFRNSDHDPVLVGLALATPPSGAVLGAGWVDAVPGRRGQQKAFFALAAHLPGAGADAGILLTHRDVSAGLSLVAVGAARVRVRMGGGLTFTGSARVNQVPGHRYELTVVDDGRRDLLRLQVWGPTGSTVLYDSGLQRVQGTIQTEID